jgi:hypothetical protein
LCLEGWQHARLSLVAIIRKCIADVMLLRMRFGEVADMTRTSETKHYQLLEM